MVAAYPLAFAVALITGSRLGDLWGRKRLFVVGLVGFTLMSAACGLAPTAETLILFRALQGLAAAAMIPQVLTSIQVMYAPDERAAAMGFFTALAGVTAVVGPVLGAILTSADIAGTGWRSIFLVNVPVGILAIVAAVSGSPNSHLGTPPRHRRPRRAGPRRRPPRRPLPAHHGPRARLARLGLRADRRRRRHARRVRPPPAARRARGSRAAGRPQPLPDAVVRRGLRGARLLFVAMGATFLCQTVYLQAGLGWTVLHAGLAGLPFAVTTSIFAGFGMAVLVPRIGTRVLQVGAIVSAAGARSCSARSTARRPTPRRGCSCPGSSSPAPGSG